MIPGSVLTPTVALARERSLPVHPALAPIFGSTVETPGSMSGLIRGHTVACVGSAAMSCALALAVAPTQTGSWVAIVGIPHIGITAAQHLGVALERTMFVAVPEPVTTKTATQQTAPQQTSSRSDLIGALSALVDGVDMIIVSRRLMTSLPSAVVRRLQARSQSRGTVLLIVGDPGSVTVDVRLTARSEHWHGLGNGHGHLQRRLVALELDGRRCGRPRRHSLWLPNDHGSLAETSSTSDLTGRDLTGDVDTLHDGVVVALRRTG